MAVLQLAFDGVGEDVEIARRAVDVGRDSETVEFIVGHARDDDGPLGAGPEHSPALSNTQLVASTS